MAPVTLAPVTNMPSVFSDYVTDGTLKGCGSWADKVNGEMFKGISDFAGCSDKCDTFAGAFTCRAFFLGVNGNTGCAVTDGSCTFKDGRNYHYYEKTGTDAPGSPTVSATLAPVSTLYTMDQIGVGCSPFDWSRAEFDSSKVFTVEECYLMCKTWKKTCVEFFVGMKGQNGCAISDGYCAANIASGRSFNYYKVSATSPTPAPILSPTTTPAVMSPTTTLTPGSEDWNLIKEKTGCQGWGGLAWKMWKDKNNSLQECNDFCRAEGDCTVFYHSESNGKCALTNGQCKDQDSTEYHMYEVRNVVEV